MPGHRGCATAAAATDDALNNSGCLSRRDELCMQPPRLCALCSSLPSPSTQEEPELPLSSTVDAGSLQKQQSCSPGRAEIRNNVPGCGPSLCPGPPRLSGWPGMDSEGWFTVNGWKYLVRWHHSGSYWLYPGKVPVHLSPCHGCQGRLTVWPSNMFASGGGVGCGRACVGPWLGAPGAAVHSRGPRGRHAGEPHLGITVGYSYTLSLGRECGSVVSFQ